MNYHIGPKQRNILRAIDGNRELLANKDGNWYLDGLPVNRERCVALHLRGFIMQGELYYASGTRRYKLTDKGKAAL